MNAVDDSINPASLQGLSEHLQSLDGAQPEMLATVRRYCDQNSGTFNLAGLQRMHDLLWEDFSNLGGQMESVEVAPFRSIDSRGELVERPLGRAIHIVARPEVRPRILLCIHMDTVYDVDHPFQTCTSEAPGRVRGPGVIDAKGGLVVMLHALGAFEASPLARHIGWEVIINPDEEIGSPGSEALLHDRAADADLGLLFEPAMPDGSLVSWRKGVGNFEFVFRGTGAHSGRDFDKGRNAVVACCRMMDEIFSWNESPEATFNPANIRGGAALNIVPDLAIGRVNIRVASNRVLTDVETRLADLVQRYSRLDGLLEGVRVEQYGRFTSPPKEVTPELESLQRRIEACGQALGQPIRWCGSGGASDGNKFAAAGLPNIDTLGPLGGHIHSDQEFLQIDSLVPKAKLTALVLLSLAADRAKQNESEI